jgi:hypothetical protein
MTGLCLLLYGAVLVILANVSIRVDAITADGKLFNATQPNGKNVTLCLRGDEHYNWKEDKDGYVVTKINTTATQRNGTHRFAKFRYVYVQEV